MSATATIAERAANVIHTYGWTQGELGSDKDGYCLVGALGVAVFADLMFSTDDLSDTFEALRQHTDEAGLLVWNDDPARTRQEVLDLLDRIGKEQQ